MNREPRHLRSLLARARLLLAGLVVAVSAGLVWVDGAGYIRQFEMSYDETLSGNTVSMSMIMSMSDYGTTVDVSAPPADQVFDATELAAQGAASALNGTTH